MKYVCCWIWVSFWVGFLAQAQVDPCSEVSPVAAFVNPFDVNQLHLASFNSSTTEFFGYPSWKVFDAEGNLIAEETLNYFGLVDTTWHLLNVLTPLAFDVETLDVTLELTWNAIEGIQTCSYAHVLEPWVPTPDPDAECVMVNVEAWGTAEPGTGFHLVLSNDDTAEVVSELDVIANDAGIYPYENVAAWCLDLESCYTLAWEPLGGPSGELPLYVGLSPGNWGSAWSVQYMTLTVGPEEPGLTYLDAYEPGCDTTGGVDILPSGVQNRLAWSGANPISSEARVPEAWCGADVMALDGRALGRVSPQGAWPRGTRGWVMLRHVQAGIPSVARVLVINP